MMWFQEIKRLSRIIGVILSYGLDEALPDEARTRLLKMARRGVIWKKNEHAEKPLGERLRLALQSLGPVWIKLGQMMSTRRDLFPPHIADQLALLQDQVAPFDGKLARQQIEEQLGKPIEHWFDEFNETPLASASIAQVHTAILRETGEEVVLKVIRPDILPVIEADMRLMYRLAELAAKWLPEGRRLRPVEVVSEYEKTLFNELDLHREAANAIQLRRNFQDNDMLYVPKIHSDFTRPHLLVMERIYGIPVSDVQGVIDNGTDMKLLSENAVTIFFTQVFRDSFFHADMHPGNIFVSRDHPEQPQWIALDCGIIGTLNKADKRYLAENLLAFFNRDYRKVAELHVDSGWVPSDTNIDEFEVAIRTVCEPIFAKPLCDISFGHVLLNLFNTARQFNMEVQPQLVLLQKTLLYVEGLGRQLYPQLDLWQTAKPFLEEWMSHQVGPYGFIDALKQHAPFWAEKLPEVPDLLYDSLRQGKVMNQRIELLYSGYMRSRKAQGIAKFHFGIGATLVICSAILFGDQIAEWPMWLAGIGGVFWFLGWRSFRS